MTYLMELANTSAHNYVIFPNMPVLIIPLQRFLQCYPCSQLLVHIWISFRQVVPGFKTLKHNHSLTASTGKRNRACPTCVQLFYISFNLIHIAWTESNVVLSKTFKQPQNYAVPCESSFSENVQVYREGRCKNMFWHTHSVSVWRMWQAPDC
jgi:hypothetical protein